MANITNLKRKAQKLVQKGQYPEAIDMYIDIVNENDSDPYDFVVLGDLLLRDDQTEIAVERYQEAVDAYVQGGLHRNAIALSKRIRRLTPGRLIVQRQLGDLYLKEGLNTEAALHYLEYLENAKDEEDFSDAAEEICNTLLKFRLPSFDLVSRVVEIAKQVERAGSLAPLVFQQFQWAQQEGQTQAAGTLLKVAQGLAPEIEALANSPTSMDIDPGDLELKETSLKRPGRDSHMDIGFNDPSSIDLGDPAKLSDDEAAGLESALGDLELGVVDLPEVTQDAVPAGTKPDESGIFDLDEAMLAESDQESSDTESNDTAAELLQRADRSLERGKQVLAQREYIRAAQAFVVEDALDQAEDIFAKVVKLDPNHIEALEGLLNVATSQGDPEKQIAYACDLGDVYLARELYGEALVQFESVLELDSDHQKAKSRVVRLKSLNEKAEEAPSRAEEAEQATVTVRDEVGQPTQTENDLAAILEEFRSSIVEAIPDDDAQSHYDMGMAFRDMQLFEEAIQEFQFSMTDEAIRPQALEMMAECNLSQGRYEEALNLLEEVLAYAEDPSIQARIHLAMGRCHMGDGQIEGARESFHKALDLNEDLVEAAELLQELELRKSGE